MVAVALVLGMELPLSTLQKAFMAVEEEVYLLPQTQAGAGAGVTLTLA
jgi:hypothetical protein